MNQSGLTAGTYNLTVTDANGCTATGSWILSQPTSLVVTATTDDSLIGTCSDAQLNATVSGGAMPVGGYLYSWSPAAGLSAANIANPVATPASTTTYTVTVTDANGCVKTGSVTVNVAPVLTAVASAADNMIGACPSSDTQLNVTVSGGEAPYSYSWLPVAGLSSASVPDPTAKPAANTTYTVTVTDANGCTATANVTLTGATRGIDCNAATPTILNCRIVGNVEAGVLIVSEESRPTLVNCIVAGNGGAGIEMAAPRPAGWWSSTSPPSITARSWATGNGASTACPW